MVALKGLFRPMSRHTPADGTFERLTMRYKAAFAEYQDILDKNAELNLAGCRLSKRALLEEERAFEELDVARHALLDAAALAYPTVH
jgi:hypothetical protein